jgi:hypothetical protein
MKQIKVIRESTHIVEVNERHRMNERGLEATPKPPKPQVSDVKITIYDARQQSQTGMIRRQNLTY